MDEESRRKFVEGELQAVILSACPYIESVSYWAEGNGEIEIVSVLYKDKSADTISIKLDSPLQIIKDVINRI